MKRRNGNVPQFPEKQRSSSRAGAAPRTYERRRRFADRTFWSGLAVLALLAGLVAVKAGPPQWLSDLTGGSTSAGVEPANRRVGTWVSAGERRHTSRATPAGGAIPEGSVTHIRDGDTIEVAGVPVRIANLDCAEMDTQEGQRARRAMVDLVRGQAVTCELEGRRSYDREVGTCALADTGEDLGNILIGQGLCGRWR